ncbi:MAG: sugar ABC transporter permease [Treponema sp.]|jgi:multiple sugar transport system permease protein|nr:sugar ABC transporter permease [Treponema sp.]
MKQRSFELSLERGDLLPLLMMLPTLLVIVFMMAAPLCYGFFLSFFNARFGVSDYAESFAGIDNYIRFFKDPAAYKAIFNTLYFSFGAIAGDFVLGTLCAVFLVKIPRLVAAVLRPIVTIPLLVSPVVVGLIWRYIYDPMGILYWFLGIFGLGMKEFPGVTAASTSMLSVIIAHWWQVTPFIIIVLTAGLLSIPEEYYEAAKIDGAGAFSIFFRITLPQLRNVYMVIMLISGVDTVKVFDIIYSLTGGGPNNSSISLSIYAYSQGFEQSNLSYSMAISFMTMLITFLVFGIPFARHNLGRGNG